MKNDKIMYWLTTIFLGVMQGAAGAMNFFSPVPAERFKMLGYPPHLLIVLGFAEVFGVLAL
jgi:hypothetical protein